MRIIGGRARGRKLLAPGRRSGALIRPTSDRAREALFNIIASKVAGSRVLDLFAGTGAFGLEAISRGASSALFVDDNQAAIELIERNLAACGFAALGKACRADLARGLACLTRQAPAGAFDLVFLDPPYGQGLGQAVLAALTAASHPLLAREATIILEDRATAICPEASASWRCVDQRRYGEAGFWFYRHQESDTHE